MNNLAITNGMVMPSRYVEIGQEEMTYIEGGGKVPAWIVSNAIDFGLMFTPIGSFSAIARLGEMGAKKLILKFLPRVSAKIAEKLGGGAFSAITTALGNYNKVAGIITSCWSAGGLVSMIWDLADKKLDGVCRW